MSELSLGIRYANFIAKHEVSKYCFFCESRLDMDGSGMYKEEVGEWWSKTLQNSVLGHPDCLPDCEAALTGNDPEWSMA
jgi:hypothetical protein